MKLLKLLSKAGLSISIIFFFIQYSYSTEPVDIWKIENKTNDEKKIVDNENIKTEDISTDSIFQIQSKRNDVIEIKEEKNLFSKDINISGIYDPSANDLSMYMWTYSNGVKILEIFNKIQNINLSKDAVEILNVALLTNSYFPKKNIDKEQFLKIKSDWLIKYQDFDLIETYLVKNNNLEHESILIRYYVDHYLSRSDLGKACDIFDKINFEINDNYITKFKIY